MAELKLCSEIGGSVWKITVAPGETVAEGDTLIILESMKMEIPVTAPQSGTVKTIDVQPAQPIGEGDALLTLET